MSDVGDMVSTLMHRITYWRIEAPGENSLAAAARSSSRRSAARSSPNAASNRACACDQPSRACCRRLSPALVRRSSLARRSDAADLILIRPSRCNGRILRPSVVRSITMSSASALIVNGPFRLSLVRIEYWVVRRPLGARNWSYDWVTCLAAARTAKQLHTSGGGKLFTVFIESSVLIKVHVRLYKGIYSLVKRWAKSRSTGT